MAMRWWLFCSVALMVCSLGCSRPAVPDESVVEVAVEEVDPHEALRRDPTFELRVGVEPEEPEMGQIVAAALFATETRRESPGVHPDGSPAEVHQKISQGEQEFLVGALKGQGFFEEARSGHSARVEAPTSAPPGDGEFEPAAGGVVRVVLITHDEEWYYYQTLIVEDREEGAAFVSALVDGVQHETAAILFGLVDLLADPF